SPPNLIFQKIYALNFPKLPEISFAKWLSIAFPISVLLLISEYFLLRIIFLKNLPSRVINREKLIENNFYKDKITTPEVITFVVFIATCGLWMFRNSFDLGFIKIPGWADSLGLSNLIDDSTISIFSAVLLYILPSNFKDLKKRILTINDLKKIPWDIILLFGGGFALADGFATTGLSDYFAQSLVGLTHMPQIALIIVVCILIVAVTEFSSNTAVASTFLPLIASLSKTLGISPIKLMLPATISASLAFMLPISTPPNAIVFSTGKIKIQEMAIVGISLNLIGIVVVSIYFYIFF
ncbi:MAG: SLC13 family permease, partial [Candidatus Kapaibacteriota bacterium]